MKTMKVPEATISRLTIYSRFLEQADAKGILTVSSTDIAKNVGVTPAQVRKDLAYFGEFGTRGIGYTVKDLLKHIRKILGLTKIWNVALIGAGNLGRALAHYKGFAKRGFEIKAIFDVDPSKIGSKIGNINVYSMDELNEKVKELDLRLGIIAVPAVAAQEAAWALVKAGIKGIINFAPRSIIVDENVILRRVDLAAELEVLTYNLQECKIDA
ncbi:MAG: redox-sensing transcriptional repressor [Thermosediminibacterales bacterium]|nr:redox-sensing transcriptional repressor [Thermosediminibacterales bacterium]MDK2835743.1 redox-sensing transcriptional repressor [Thermosediminibacterales bacterium]